MSNAIIISFSADVAKEYGDRAAYFLAYLQHCIEFNRIKGRNEFDGRTWSYNSIEDFLEKYPWLTQSQMKTVINKLLEDNVILKCKAKDELGIKRVNTQTNAYAFVNENDWLRDKNNDESVSEKSPTTSKSVSEKSPTTSDSLDKNRQHVGEKSPAVGEISPTYNSLNYSLNNSFSNEGEETLEENNIDLIYQMWQKTFSRNPRAPEILETQRLIDEFGKDETQDAMREAVLAGGKAISWARNRLEDPERFGKKKKENDSRGGYKDFTSRKTGTD